MVKQHPRVWAEVDLGAISQNIGVIKNRLLPGRDHVMLVVKADAYGHGATEVARHVLARGEAQAFGVGDSEEALELRRAGIDAPILILGAIVDGEMDAVVANDIAICCHSFSRLQRLQQEARRQGRRCRVHVMVDTGMGRLGPFPQLALELAEAIAASDWLMLEGVATHFSSSSLKDDDFTRKQIGRFLAFRDQLVARGVPAPVLHAANSGAVLYEDCSAFDMVRIGAAAYGIFARKDGDGAKLKPALSLHTQVIYMKDVPAGTTVSYNRSHVTTSSTRIATLPIGYNDGLPYALTGKGKVLVRGCEAPIVGAISMDYCMVDVGHVRNARAGDRVTLIGKDGDREITVPQLAETLQTVPYELTCRLGKRVKRVYRPERPHPELHRALKREVLPLREQIEARDRG